MPEIGLKQCTVWRNNVDCWWKFFSVWTTNDCCMLKIEVNDNKCHRILDTENLYYKWSQKACSWILESKSPKQGWKMYLMVGEHLKEVKDWKIGAEDGRMHWLEAARVSFTLCSPFNFIWSAVQKSKHLMNAVMTLSITSAFWNRSAQASIAAFKVVGSCALGFFFSVTPISFISFTIFSTIKAKRDGNLLRATSQSACHSNDQNCCFWITVWRLS